MSKRIGLTLILLCSLIWAVNPLLFKLILSEVPPYNVVMLSRVSATVSLFVIVAIIDRKGLVQAFKNFNLFTFVGGIFLGVHFIFFILGLDLTTAVATSILIQTEAVYFVIWGFAFFHESVTAKKALGMALATIGVFVVVWNGDDLSSLVGTQYFAGNMIIFLSALLFSIYMAMQKGLSFRKTGFATLLPIFLIATLLTFPLASWGELSTTPPNALVVILIVGIITALSFLFFAKSLDHVLNSVISVILLTSPVMTALIVIAGKGLDIPFFGQELLTAYLLLGGTAILLGAFLVISEENT